MFPVPEDVVYSPPVPSSIVLALKSLEDRMAFEAGERSALMSKVEHLSDVIEAKTEKQPTAVVHERAEPVENPFTCMDVDMQEHLQEQLRRERRQRQELETEVLRLTQMIA